MADKLEKTLVQVIINLNKIKSKLIGSPDVSLEIEAAKISCKKKDIKKLLTSISKLLILSKSKDFSKNTVIKKASLNLGILAKKLQSINPLIMSVEAVVKNLQKSNNELLVVFNTIKLPDPNNYQGEMRKKMEGPVNKMNGIKKNIGEFNILLDEVVKYFDNGGNEKRLLQLVVGLVRGIKNIERNIGDWISLESSTERKLTLPRRRIKEEWNQFVVILATTLNEILSKNNQELKFYRDNGLNLPEIKF